jgi:organic hydroperoxide reductase OsmC/OhrA
MSDHIAQLRWRRATPDFDLKSYNRDHTAAFKSGKPITMSAAPAYRGSADAIDPEEMLVGSLASCHMLSFLALAAGRKLVVDSYEDDAVGVLEKNADGKLAITRVTLRPRVAFANPQPDAATLEQLHHKAHEACFIANSVKCEVTIETPVHA